MSSRLKAYLDGTMDGLRAADPALGDWLAATLQVRDVVPSPTEPLGAQPVVRQLYEAARLDDVLQVANLPRAATATMRAFGSPDMIDDDGLQALVGKGVLTAGEAARVGTVVERQVVCEDAMDLVAAVGAIGGDRDNAALATMPPAQWEAALGKVNAPLPRGMTCAAAATVLARRFEVLYPGAAILGRAPTVDEAGLLVALDALEVLAATNPRRFDGAFADLDVGDVAAEVVAALEAHWNVLAAVVRGAPGLGLAELLDDRRQPTKARASEVRARVEGWRTALARAAGPALREDPLGLDLREGSADWARFDEAAAPVRAVTRGYQRMRAVGGDIDAATTLLAAGYASATAVARARLEAIQVLPGLGGARGARVWGTARDLAADAALVVAGVSDAVDDGGAPAPAQPPATVVQTLATLDGFASLFGSHAYCDCAHCASILGPAAYFVDLMHFVQEEVGGAVADGDRASLRARRPDLWTFPLTCAATTAVVPTLTIVNEALENAIATAAGYTGSVADRAAVEALVYQASAGLPGATRSFAQPFAAGLAQVAALLDGVEVDRAVVAAAVGVTTPRRVLGVSAAWEELITVPRTTLAGMREVYGIDFVAADDGAPVAAVDVEVLAPAMGLEVAGLGAVVTAWFVRQGGAAPRITSTRRSAQSVQADLAQVEGLTVGVLDRMHRLVRASRVLGLGTAPLDRLLRVMGDATLASLAPFAQLRALAAKAGVAIEADDATVFAGPLDAAGLTRWNRGVGGPGEVWPNPMTRCYHPALAADVAPGARAVAARLAAALELTLPALLTLLRLLAPQLARATAGDFDPAAADPAERYIVVSGANLTLLDRHARLARLLGLTIDELAALLPLAGIPAVASLADAVTLAEARDAWRASGRTLDHLRVATGADPGSPGVLLVVPAVAAAVRAGYAAARAVPDALFATTLGVSTAASAQILAANATRFTEVGGTRIVVPEVSVDETTVVAPAGIAVSLDGRVRDVTPADVARVLWPLTALGHLEATLATATGRAADEVAALMRLVGIGLGGVGTSIADPAAGRELEVLIGAVTRVDVATRGWSAAGLTMLAATPARFGPGAWPTHDAARPDRPTFTFAQATALGRAAGRGGAAARQAVFLAAVAAFTGTPPAFTADADGALAELLGTSVATIASLRGRVTLAPGAIAALEQLATLVRLADRLGVDGEVLRGLVADEDGECAAAAAALEHAAAARGERDGAAGTRLAAAQAAVRERRRDALVDALVRRVATPGATVPRTRLALSAWFLLDVEAGGCATTSRVVAATTTVQEYVTRVTLGLETTAAGTRVALSAAGARSWAWRRAYRLWEANRKVFLWPENYLEPGVRDDKTPLFTELEAALGQSDLDEPSIVAAYATYLHGLEELGSLQIAGAYHDVGEGAGAGTDVLHLVGVTPRDPATFYYRSVTNLAASLATAGPAARWGTWQKLDIAAPTRFVAPVVHQGRLSLLWPTTKTRAKQRLIAATNGDPLMQLDGYLHTYTLVSQTLQANGAWGPPQAMRLPLVAPTFDMGDGAFLERLDPTTRRPAYQPGTLAHDEAVDGYTLRGANWTRVVPVRAGGLKVVLRNYAVVGSVDLHAGVVTMAPLPTSTGAAWPVIRERESTDLGFHLSATRPTPGALHPDVLAEIAATEDRVTMYGRDGEAARITAAFQGAAKVVLARHAYAAEVFPVHGRPDAAIVTLGAPFLLMSTRDSADRYVLHRFGQSQVAGLGRVLFEHGLDGLLATTQQLAMNEVAPPLELEAMVLDRTGTGDVDFRGALGTYLRELFFHIPMLIATALAGRGRHADARCWFHRVFDPTSTEVIATTGVPPADVARRQLDRVWRYREFRGQSVEGARATLTDGAALAAYRDEPFNPHAIARCRLTAYQRHVVGRYVDNLLDWGDLLFAQFEREPVEEARGLYQVAAQLLGARPTRLGACDRAVPDPRDYDHIAPLLTAAEPARVGAETEVLAQRQALPAPPQVGTMSTLAARARLTRVQDEVPWAPAATSSTPVAFDRRWSAGATGAWAPAKALGATAPARAPGGAVGAPPGGAADDTLATSVVTQLGPVFCVPANPTLLARWDRVEDRLWKLHHCRDLDGVRRDLALFAPALEPMARVEATALGLTPDDLVAEAATEVPPYRFAYLIERAKGVAASLAGFGGALLGALERRDSEALARLRQEQGLALARLTRQQRDLDVAQARAALAALDRQVEATAYRRTYYDELLTTGLSGGEAAELGLRGTAAAMHTLAEVGHLTAATVRLLPTINAPWSVSFGGENIAQAAEHAANWLARRTLTVESVAGVMGLTAGYARRADGWRHQRQLATDELGSLVHQRRAAALRVTVAEQALRAHDASVGHLEDALAFERARVTNLELHTRLAQGVKQLYRLAYGHALALARLAERAYRYERGDPTGGLAAGYWDASLGGLLAGERLLADLQALDRRFLETHHRELEIDQPFALSDLDPAALLVLRETGTCTFEVPEVAFDLAYPGHYRRRLRAVRLTIPCVTAPYVNVSATLALVASQVRATPTAALVEVPAAHGTTIAASSAQADGGVFELAFRDERYLPFEGQGAVSRWTLTLPRTVRAFEYATISDVVLALAYSARPDGGRRAVLEAEADPGGLLAYYRAHPTQRVVSLREALPASLTRLGRSAVGTPVEVALPAAMLPPVYRGRSVEVAAAGPLLAGVALRLAAGVEPRDAVLVVDGQAVTGFQREARLGGLWFAPVAWAPELAWPGTHTLAVTALGGLGRDDVRDPATLLDLLLLIPVRLGAGAV